jgi:hypothetical protein
MKNKGYVYLLVSIDMDGNELYKIGITKKEISKRISQLQTGNPNEIRLLCFYESVNYKKVEQFIHSRYSLNKTLAKNEWFHLSDSQILNFIKDCQEIEKTILFLIDNNPFFK